MYKDKTDKYNLQHDICQIR